MPTPHPENAQAPLGSEAKRKLQSFSQTNSDYGFAQGEVRICELLFIACRELAKLNAQLKQIADQHADNLNP
jgi:hypothetical protein